ncbi:MAG: hypothetical protein J6R79_03965 [Bacteroidaceae bacterium]|nr:hypothetical protein [Bacteroidaceae bacterium]
MNKIFVCFILGLFLVAQSTAQRRKKAQKPNTIELAYKLIQQKDYPKAIESLQVEIENQQKLRRPKLDINKMQSMIDSAQVLLMRIQNTQRVLVIDSIVLPKTQVLNAITLSDGMGKIMTTKQLISMVQNQFTPQGDIAFVNELNDHAFFSYQTNDGNLKLYNSVRYDKQWGAPQPVNFVENTDSTQGFPFMLTDGITLYFAAKGKDSFGGWDIYETRYDRDSNSFLRPQNLGMPFNTEYNDYLYVMDETTNTGYFATDRHHGPDSVCIYTFIPSNIYVTYSQDTPFAEMLSAAYLTNIKQTQFGRGKEIAQWEVEKKKQQKYNRKEISNSFVINNRTCYSSLDEFKNKDARSIAEQILNLQSNRENAIKFLDVLRNQYHQNPNQVVKDEILSTEAQLMETIKQIHQLEKEMRKLENQ